MEPKSNLEKKLYSRNYRKHGFDLNPIVSLISGLFIIIFAGYAILNLDGASKLFGILNNKIVSNWDWLFILSSNFFIGICLYLAFSKLGNVRIGGVDARPEFSNFAWYSMLISAGMGIGLMFWAVGEPLIHSQVAPPIFESSSNVGTAMASTFFHWGFHPWGIYALLGLALAFFAYNKNLPLSLRSVFYPIFKDKVFGVLGDMIDVLAVIACLFGLATSLGLGVQQMNSGLNYLFNVPESVGIQVILIVSVTFLAIISVVSGVHKGIKTLSKLNIRLAGIFMLCVLLLGPTFYILKVFSNGLGIYLNDFIKSSFFVSMNDGTWQGDWSVFYLSWWISWSPFVGMFIARMSRGRTVREFITAVLIVPSFLSFLWMSVFGGTAVYINENTGGKLFETVQNNLPVALFELIEQINVPFLSEMIITLLSLLGTLLIMSYFITSSDSGSLVVENITSGGKINTPKKQRVFWASVEGLVAAVLLLVGGKKALDALQTAVISTGLPFTFILIIASFSMVKGIRSEYVQEEKIKRKQLFEDAIEYNENR